MLTRMRGYRTPGNHPGRADQSLWHRDLSRHDLVTPLRFTADVDRGLSRRSFRSSERQTDDESQRHN